MGFVGWDTAAIVIKDTDMSIEEYHLLVIDRWGFHSYELLDKLRKYELEKTEMAILPINLEIEDENGIYEQLVKPFLDMSHKVWRYVIIGC